MPSLVEAPRPTFARARWTAAAPPDRAISASRSEDRSSGRPLRPWTRKNKWRGSAAGVDDIEAVAEAAAPSRCACPAAGERKRRVANDSSGVPKTPPGGEGGEAARAGPRCVAGLAEATRRVDASLMRRGSVTRGRSATMRCTQPGGARGVSPKKRGAPVGAACGLAPRPRSRRRGLAQWAGCLRARRTRARALPPCARCNGPPHASSRAGARPAAHAAARS